MKVQVKENDVVMLKCSKGEAAFKELFDYSIWASKTISLKGKVE